MKNYLMKHIRSFGLRASSQPRIMRFVLIGVVVPAFVGAQTPSSPVNSLADFARVLCDIGYIVYAFALVIGIVMAIVAAYKYMFSSGDTNKVSEAHKTLTYAAVGLAVAFVAWGMPNIVMDILGGDAVEGCEAVPTR